MNVSYPRSAWLTFWQASELGARIRRGEAGTSVVFYKMLDLPHSATIEQIEDQRSSKVIPLLRHFTVFNIAQVDGLPERLQVREVAASWDPHCAAETILHESRARIRHGGGEAYYSPADDRIQLPERGLFVDAGAYYATALHELTHWTGHPGRLNRNLGKRFGEAAYAIEELVAEIGSAFLCASCYLEGHLRHANYVSAWLKVLKNDKRAIFAAAAKAQQATDFIESVCATPPEAANEEAARPTEQEEAGAA